MEAREPNRSPASKRQKLNEDQPTHAAIASLEIPISPPPSRRRRSATPEVATPRIQALQQAPQQAPATSTTFPSTNSTHKNGESRRLVPSPIQLTRIQDLAREQNVDTIGLQDILGDPMIKECWNFNFLFDIGFVMDSFNSDVRSLVEVKIVHGFWKRDDERRIEMMETAERFPNVELISAYIPDPFGTHHSKMLILFRHDDTAQVIIHTANMITRDWQNMTQAVWSSPVLPLSTSPPGSQTVPRRYPIGSGERFKVDLIRYLNAYERKLRGLIEQLMAYDFSAIRAAFIGSAPSRQKSRETVPSTQTSFGWLGVREILSSIPIRLTEDSESPPNIVIQTSSIATLGATPAWLTNLQSVLSRSSTSSLASTGAAPTSSKASDFFAKRSPAAPKAKAKPPTFSIIFPTADEIRESLDGYKSGFSIHTKLQSPTQQKQLEYMRPLLCHWRQSSRSMTNPQSTHREAHRGPAAPHIKTYLRFSTASQKTIDWAMVTSANLSKQAWGEMENKKGEVWIQSWECGIIVWPDLFKEDGEESGEMVPVFGRDRPDTKDLGIDDEEKQGEKKEGKGMVVGFRMPYDRPLQKYGDKEVPWCASAAHNEVDWRGQLWNGYQPH